MAKINPVKVKQDADKLEKAGKLDQAIVLYRQIVDDNPRDWNTINKIGDLYAKMNKFREASDEYAKVADFYAKDGFLLKAIAIWKKINKLDASSLDPYLNLADLYAKQGLMMEAKSQYQIVVDEYIKRGKMRDAGDVLKKMAEIDPGDLKVRSKLADLYTRDGNAGKAVDEHIAIADELTKKGHLAEALQVLEKGLKLDPKSSRLRQELARIHLVQKNYERAAHFLEEAVRQAPSDAKTLAKLGEAYVGGKKIEEAEAIFKRLLELDPDDLESHVQMGRVYLLQGQFDQAYEELVPIADKMLERREGDKAAALLQQVVQANPSHIKTLVKLAEIYRQLQKEAPSVQTYSQLTEAYINVGQMDQAASVLEILVSLEPQNQQHKTKLQFVRSKRGAAPAAPASAPAPEIEEEEFDLEATSEAPAFLGFDDSPPASTQAPAPAAVAVVSPAAPTIELTGPLSDEDKEFVEEHLAEGRVFRKYGLVDKATDQFEAIVARFPDDADARQELKEVYKEKGNNAKAGEQCLALAAIFRLKGDEDQAAAWETEARAFVPVAAPVAKPAAAAKPAAPAAKPAAPKPAPPPEPEEEVAEEEISFAESEEEINLEVEEGGLESEALSESAEELPLDLGDEGGELPSHFVEEEQEEQPAPEPEPALGAVEAGPGLALDEELTFEAPEPEPPPPPAPLRAAPARPPARPAPATAKAPAPPPPSGLPGDLQKVLDEVDSYVSLGFVEDAHEALREISARYPGHAAIVEKMAELGLGQEVVEEETPPPPPPRRPAPRVPVLSVPGARAPAPRAPEPPTLDFEEELVVPAAADEETSPLDDAFGDLSIPEPEPTFPEPPASPKLPEPSFAEPFSDDTLESPLGDSLLADAGLEEPEPFVAELPAPEPSQTIPEPVLDSLRDFAAPSVPEGGLDLGAELGDLFGAQPAVEAPSAEGVSSELGDSGLAEIFKEFKKGVDKQLGKEDYDTRYNLGIAYKEMGLVDEAIAEFQLAAKDEGRLLECSSMLGICFMEKGMPKLAVKWFEKGLKAPDRSDEEYRGLRYDLATAHEAGGDVDKALVLFTDIYGQDANFRDVASKVQELKAALG